LELENGSSQLRQKKGENANSGNLLAT